MAFVGVQQVVHHHRIQQLAAYGRAVAFQHGEVVLDVLAYFFGAFVGEERGKLGDDGLGAGPVGGYGDVVGLAFPPAETEADEVGGGSVHARRLGVEGVGFLLPEVGDQGGAFFGRVHFFVVLLGVANVVVGQGVSGGLCVAGAFSGRGRGCGGGCRSKEVALSAGLIGGLFFHPQNVVGDAAELELAEDVRQVLTVEILDFVSFGVKGDAGDFRYDGSQHFALQGLVVEFSQALLVLALYLVFVFQQVLDAAVLLNEFGGRLRPDARYAGNIVHLVAHQPQQVDDLQRILNVPLGLDLVYAENIDAVAHPAGLVHIDVLLHQLAVVFVGGNHVHLEPFAGGLLGEGTDHVVRLVVVDHDDRNIEALKDLVDVREGHADVLRLFLAVGFVIGRDLVAEGRPTGVENDGQVGGRLVFHQVPQRPRKAKHSRGIDPLGVDHRPVDEGKVRTVHQRVTVEKEEFFGWLFGHGAKVRKSGIPQLVVS